MKTSDSAPKFLKRSDTDQKSPSRYIATVKKFHKPATARGKPKATPRSKANRGSPPI